MKKFLVYLLFLSGLGYLGYKYRVEIKQFVDTKIIKKEVEITSESTPGVAPEEVVTHAPKKPSIVSRILDGKSSKESALEEEIASQYPLPRFPTLETRFDNWRKVPANAFPQTVKLKSPVEANLIVGGQVRGRSTLTKGAPVVPLKLEKGQLRVSPSKNGKVIALTPISNTDFKEQIQARYDAWKSRQMDRVYKQREAARKAAEENMAVAEGTGSTRDDPEPKKVKVPRQFSAALGARPQRDPDGSIPIMKASIRKGDVKEIKLDKIAYWKLRNPEFYGGTEYWVGLVGYEAETIFGLINTEGMALIRGGKVEKWVYSGSLEPIP
ncbi:MAG: hypothetical protein AAF514_12780 [Verrucomicrobiota bacterium]